MKANGLSDRFAGSLLGGMVGDVIGSPVEAESPGYIRKSFKDLDAILALKTVPELISGEWEVGRFTDDTQMTLCVADWLVSDYKHDGKNLLEKFCQAYEPWRHYGPGARMILESFHSAGDRWPELATAMFPQGSYGNGSAMRVAPIGLLFHNDFNRMIEVARISSAVTHSHWLAIQGATLQAAAVAQALKGEMDARSFIVALKPVLDHFAKLGQDISVYRKALAQILIGISKNVLPARMSRFLGNGIKAQEAVPMAIYCFLANRNSFENAVTSAVFLGGDTDTIASMTGAISGAALGESAIPKRWLDRITETTDTPEGVRRLATKLFDKTAL